MTSEIEEFITAGAHLPKTLQNYGWSEQTYDLCWLACARVGYRNEQQFPQYADEHHPATMGLTHTMEICLCRTHIRELERMVHPTDARPFNYWEVDGPEPIRPDGEWPWQKVDA